MLKLGVTICLSQVALPIDQPQGPSGWLILQDVKIDRNIPELQEASSHVVVGICLLLLGDVDTRFWPSQVGGRVRGVVAGAAF